VNGSHVSQLHTDANNDGDNYGIAVGDFSGGKLFIADDTGQEKMNVVRKMQACPNLNLGQIVKGRHYNIKNSFERFSGQHKYVSNPISCYL